MTTRERPLDRPAVARRARTRRGPVIAAWTTIVVVLTAGLYVPAALLAPVPAAVATVSAPVIEAAPAPAIAFPAWGRGAIATLDDPLPLAAYGGDDAVPMASITKLVTALTVLEARPIEAGGSGAEITLTAADVAIWEDEVAMNAAVQPVRAGLTLTQRQVLELVLVPSAGNYSESLAAWAFGSRDAYLAAASDWLTRQGLRSTVVVDASGIDAGNRSSPTDLLQLGRLALANPVVAEIVRTSATSVPGVGDIRSTNRLLGMEGLLGIKTGNTDEAGTCLLFAQEIVVGDERIVLVGVLLGADGYDELFAGVPPVLASAAAGFREVVLVEAGQVLGSATTAWGARTDLVASERRTEVLRPGEEVSSAVDAAVPADRTVVAGERVGDAAFTAGAERIDVAVLTEDELPDADWWWRLTNPTR